ncbi:hypothetical protein ACN6J9_02760 [Carnobacterium maltaromaticum]|uniref:hypothetical protein n=1 Tax=Carnobacterium maltaromaticum TaxID=2751 RepID=UPI00070514CC|nr:hypothetical protein [Carnobacterium maltaromaticum]KRN72346.1 hypothetical protein IV76_GL002572 [Carnobacterium maltaromaticum]CRH18116.1 membrane hypothetical protein [Carnobacterium maltaromaticum]
MDFSLEEILNISILPLLLGIGYQIFYLATADQLAKSLASRNKQFTLFLTARLLVLGYSFIFVLIIYSNIMNYSGVDALSELNSQDKPIAIMLFIVTSLSVWGFFEFVFSVLKKTVPTSIITKKARYYFNSNDLSKLKLKNHKIFILEKINSTQIICYYKLENEYIRIILLPSDLNGLGILIEKEANLITKIKKHFSSYKDSTKKNNCIVFCFFSAIVFGFIYITFDQFKDVFTQFPNPPLLIIFIFFIYLMFNLFFLFYYVSFIIVISSRIETIFLPFFFLKNKFFPNNN